MSSVKKLTVLLLLLLFNIPLRAQMYTANGKTIPANGILRVLLIFVEIDYDKTPSLDPAAEMASWTKWKKGQLPEWSDDFFSPDTQNLNRGKLTRFYAESSFNNFVVLGDYLDRVITIKESEVANVSDASYHLNKIREMLNDEGKFRTRHKLNPADFDLWTFTKPGEKKITPSTDIPHRFDHVMFIYRNLKNLPDANGRAYPYSCGKFFGFDSDSYSQFGAYNLMPFNITRHEFTHLFLGDNNFHIGGGERMGNNCYLMSIQCMWSIIGAANASLLCCNAWDRDRFDWKPKEKKYNISAWNENKTEVEADISVTDSVYRLTLRDFITTGDAVRIKLPEIAGDEFPQYLWIENHTTVKNNKSEFDQFQFHEYDCREPALAGLYIYIQIEHDVKTGPDIYRGHADYLHPISAEGAFDYFWDTVKVKNECVNDVMYPVLNERRNNALTGTQTFEIPPLNYDNNDALAYPETGMPYIERIDGQLIKRLRPHGISQMAFNSSTINYISNFTNPSTTNIITSQSYSPQRHAPINNFQRNAKYNSKTIYLNGLYTKIVSENSDGSITVEIGFNDYNLRNNIRWCADSILLPKGKTMCIKKKVRLLLDQGETPTRNNQPIIFDNKKIFANPTKLVIPNSSILKCESEAKLTVDNGSNVYLLEGSKLIAEENSVIEIKNNSQLIMRHATIELKKGARLIIHGRNNFIKDEKCRIQSENEKQIIYK